MNITWEDRKSSGRIDEYPLTVKPVFSFPFAWFLVTDETAQYVESHEYGYWNHDMTVEQRQEVESFYAAYEFPPVAVAPEVSVIQVAVDEGTIELVDSRRHKTWIVVDRFADYTDEQGVFHSKADQEAAAIAEEQARQAEVLQASVVAETQARLDNFARTRNYDGILSACTYATSSVPKFQAEGQYAVTARDNTWATLYTILGEVQAGTRPVPTGFADIEPDLPVLVWPQ